MPSFIKYRAQKNQAGGLGTVKKRGEGSLGVILGWVRGTPRGGNDLSRSRCLYETGIFKGESRPNGGRSEKQMSRGIISENQGTRPNGPHREALFHQKKKMPNVLRIDLIAKPSAYAMPSSKCVLEHGGGQTRELGEREGQIALGALWALQELTFGERWVAILKKTYQSKTLERSERE